MYSHDLEHMGSNPGPVELEMCSTSVYVVLKQKHNNAFTVMF